MANPAKKLVRKVLKGRVLRSVENEFRLARASYANARYHWPARGMKVIMITGTNGKTTTAHYLFSILRQAGYSVGLSSTAEFRINNKIEINDTNMTVVDPIKLRRQLADFKAHSVDYVILEATSQALDQHRLFGIPCEVAIFTNLTQDHLDYHKTMKRYATAKAKLWQFKPLISVLNKDDEWFAYFKERATGKLVTYGKPTADVAFRQYQATPKGARYTLTLHDGNSVINSLLPGEYNAYNAVAAAAAAEALGVKGEYIERGIEALGHVTGRMQAVKADIPYKIVVDYAHTPDGLEKALTAARDLTAKTGKLWLVFGSCGDRDKLKRPLMGKIAAKQADKIVLTDEESYSENPATIRQEVMVGISGVKGGKAKTVEIADRKSALKYALENAKKGDLVLATGLGHEQFRVTNGKKIPWNDAEVIKKLLK